MGVVEKGADEFMFLTLKDPGPAAVVNRGSLHKMERDI